ncbi:DNA-3-methyladenine glycosylase I [Halalkalibaculum sp. DA384]|uniref:DNA-3-methyladenine glycosylase I n=1 Tax=Halalkalibaculum sp. DA384 TaxID=3373606 RepID=UPI003754C8AC
MKNRCEWCEDTFPEYVRYHDKEWGVPVTDDRVQFEFLILESAQAGLSWSTILKKRAGYRQAFSDFDVDKVACFSEKKIQQLTSNPEIIRNEQKIRAAVNNARKFIDIREAFGSFSKYIWSFVGGRPINNRWQSIREVPSTSEESDKLASDLKKRGFKFVGSTIMYAHMQAVGMVNDHTVDCFRHKEVEKEHQNFSL